MELRILHKHFLGCYYLSPLCKPLWARSSDPIIVCLGQLGLGPDTVSCIPTVLDWKLRSQVAHAPKSLFMWFYPVLRLYTQMQIFVKWSTKSQ